MVTVSALWKYMIILERSGKCKNHHRQLCCVDKAAWSRADVSRSAVSVCPVPAPGNNVNNKSCGSRGFVSRPLDHLLSSTTHHHCHCPSLCQNLRSPRRCRGDSACKETLGKSTAICFQSIRNSCTDFPTNRTFELSSRRNPHPTFQLENRFSGKQSNTVGKNGKIMANMGKQNKDIGHIMKSKKRPESPLVSFTTSCRLHYIFI